jgi:hypothetical protein
MLSLLSTNPALDQRLDNRTPISREKMQAAITEAVKKADPDCAAFVGVFVERTTRTSVLKANWAVKGFKFGRSDRNKAGDAVSRVVERMQRDFDLSDGVSGEEED